LSDEQEAASGSDSLIKRLFRRHVIQAAAIYVAVAWGAVEILLTLTERLGWPDWINTVALAIFIAGFPVVIILSWYRDVESKAARSLLVVFALAMGVTAFWLVSTSSGPQAPVPSASAGPYQTQTVATIAILSFENLTGDESQQYIANGFTDDIISRLSKHPDLAVIQNESSNSPLLASLIPTAQAARLWSESFSDPLTADNLLSTQKRISGEVSRIVGTTLSAPAYCGETTNFAAMELYYQGRNRILMRQRENIEAGIELLKKAVDEDPYYGRAWNVLGEGYLSLPAWIFDPAEARTIQATHHPMGFAALERALQICATLGMAYKVMVPSYEGVTNGWADQELQFRDALAMDPNDVSLLRQYYRHLTDTGRISAALDVAKRAYQIDPLAAAVVIGYARLLQLADRCAEAIPLSAEGREIGGSKMRYVELNCARDSETLLEVLDYQSSLTGGGNMLESVGIEMSNEDFAALLFDANHPGHKILRAGIRTTWASNPGPRNFANTHIVGLAIQSDDFDFAFEVLNDLVDGHQIAGYLIGPGGMWISLPTLNRFRADPRFTELMERVGLAEYWHEFGWSDRCRPDGDTFSCS